MKQINQLQRLTLGLLLTGALTLTPQVARATHQPSHPAPGTVTINGKTYTAQPRPDGIYRPDGTKWEPPKPAPGPVTINGKTYTAQPRPDGIHRPNGTKQDSTSADRVQQAVNEAARQIQHATTAAGQELAKASGRTLSQATSRGAARDRGARQVAHDWASKVGTGTTVVGPLTQVGQSDVFRRDLLKAIEDYHRRGWGRGKSVEAYFPYAQKVQKASKVVGGVTTVVGVGAGVVRMATATNPEDRVLGGLNAVASAIPGPYGKAASIGVTAGEMIGNIDTGLADPLNRRRSMNVRGVIAEGFRSTYIQPKSGSIVQEWLGGWKDLYKLTLGR